MLVSRRDFLISSALSASLLPLIPTPALAFEEDSNVPKISIFSKHLQFLNVRDMALAARDLGFDGIDLTVRPGGHVLPEKVESDLPKAVEAMSGAEFSPLLFCTAVDDASNPVDRKVLETAAGLGFKNYRMNWYRYNEEQSIPQSLTAFTGKIAALSQLNAQLGLTGAYQNHAGRMVGATMFEIWEMLKNANLDHMGVQYDIRHATIEGGLSWQTGFNLIRNNIKSIVLKDSMWEKKDGKWTVKRVPIGEGMVDFTAFFKLLKANQIQVPMCLHLEYTLGGAEDGETKITVDKKVVFDAMKKDLAKVRSLWQQA